MQDDSYVYVIKSVSPVIPGDAASAPGRVIFTEEPVPMTLVEDGLERCLETARRVIARSAALAAAYEVESITLKLALDGKVGVAFIADAGVEAAIEVEIKRKKL